MSRWTISMLLAGSLAVGGALMGCKEEPKPGPAKTNTTPPATNPTTNPTTTTGLPKIDVPKVDVPKVDVPKVDVPKTTDVTKTADTAAKEQGSKLLDQLDTAIKAGKVDDASSLVGKLDAIKDKLPDDLKTKFDTLKKALADLKTKGAAIPKLPGGDNK